MHQYDKVYGHVSTLATLMSQVYLLSENKRNNINFSLFFLTDFFTLSFDTNNLFGNELFSKSKYISNLQHRENSNVKVNTRSK